MLEGGVQAQDGRRGIAAGVGHQAGLGGLGGVELGQAVDGLGQQLAAGVGHIPVFIDIDVTQAEVGGKVDDTGPGLQQFAGHLHGLAVGHGQEDQVAAAGGFLGIEDADDHVRTGQTFEEGIELAQAQAGFGTGTGHLQFHAGVAGQQPGQFHAGVPGDAHKTHFEYLHLPLLYLRSGPHLMTYFMRNS